MIEWFEDLPEQCPPKDALEPSGEIYYRLVSNIENPIEELISQRLEFPTKAFEIDECTCCAVSIYSDKKDCENITKFPRHKKKKIYEFSLAKNDGLVKQTFKPSHHSWWRSNNFAKDNE
ncbi:hypothetical protein [Chryseobacterium scophthalmum]|uniref:hypothetical protein n=1 Tax=Chryseobacterium scophthalmum TaxID=59733 RepID=UPI001AEC6BFE|nr:hypothetical protein [Chryseobacterium scophthalmum]